MKNNFQEFWDKKWPKHYPKIGPTTFGIKIQNFIKTYYKDKKISLLDLGSGAGRDAVYFFNKGQKVTALDFSQNAIELIRKNFQDIVCICDDYESFDFGQEKYELIYSCCSLHYFSIEDFENILKKLQIALSENGVFVMRVKDLSDGDLINWKEISKNYFTNGTDYKFRFTKDILLDAFSSFGEVDIKISKDVHQLLGAGNKTQKYFDVIAIR